MPATAHSGGLLAGVAVGCDLGGGAQVLSLQIAWVWRAIQARYRPYQLRQPLFKPNQFSSLAKMLGSVRGRPLNLKFPIQKHTVRWLLAWRPPPSHDDGGAPGAPPDGGGNARVPVGSRSRAAASLRSVV